MAKGSSDSRRRVSLALAWALALTLGLGLALLVICIASTAEDAGTVRKVELQVDGLSREYYVQHPLGDAPAAGWPVVFAFHSWGSSASSQAKTDGFRQRALRSAIVVHPEGFSEPTELRGYRKDHWSSWHASGSAGKNADGGAGGEICEPDLVDDDDWQCYQSCQDAGFCTKTGGGPNKCRWSHCRDDVSFVLAMVQKLQEETCVDTSRIFAAGESNGGMMAFELAADPRSANIFSSLVAVSALPHNGFNRGPINISTRLLLILGTQDNYVFPFANVLRDPNESLGLSSGFYFSSWTNTTSLWASSKGLGGIEESRPLSSAVGANCTGWSDNGAVEQAELATCFHAYGHEHVPPAAWELSWAYLGIHGPSPDELRSPCMMTNHEHPAPFMTVADKVRFLGVIALAGYVVVALAQINHWRLTEQRRQLTLLGDSLAGTRPQEATFDSSISVGPAKKHPMRTVMQQFLDHALERPERVALVADVAGRRVDVSYGVLADRALRIARQLTTLGVQPGCNVAIILDRGLHQVAALYGVFLVGAAWVPVSPDAPRQRMLELVSDSRVAVVLAQSGLFDTSEFSSASGVPVAVLPLDGSQLLVNGERVDEWQGTLPEVGLLDRAIVFYTSGTTGKPKGVIYSHAMVNHESCNFAATTEMTESSVGIIKSPHVWAGIVWEVFAPLARGARAVVVSASGHKDPALLAELILAEKVTLAFFTPKILDLVLNSHASGMQLHSLKHVVAIGEPLPVQLADRFVRMRGLSAKLHNCYASTESNTTAYTVPNRGLDPNLFPSRVPVGRPQAGGSVWVLDAERRPVPAGEAGEVCFGGQIADGYWNNQEMTQAKFVELPGLGRVYCSGDLGRWHGGELDILGRVDRQVKINGVRVEPEEIEVVVRAFRGEWAMPTDAAVVATKGEQPELVVFVAPNFGRECLGYLEQHCRASLPPYFMPKHFFSLERLPTLASGKTNLRELADMAAEELEKGQKVLDSLGVMQNMSRDALLENQIIHRCYATWMLCVVVGHWYGCAEDPFRYSCMALSKHGTLPAWVELFLRQMGGGDQTMFGFIILGALQDSQPKPCEVRPKVQLGQRDIYMFAVFVAMACPIPQLLFLLAGPDFVDPGAAASWPGWIASHRWYLFMVLWSRLCLRACQAFRIPGWAQVVLQLGLALVGPESALDPCSCSSLPEDVQWVAGWLTGPYMILPASQGGCPIFFNWLQWYAVLYVAAFHFCRPCIAYGRRVLVTPCGGPGLAAAAFGVYLFLGCGLAAFHYPDVALNYGVGDPEFRWYWLPVEIGVNLAQAVLLPLGMAWLPFDLSWWGASTLGSYVFHFYWREDIWSGFVQRIAEWPTSGVLQLIVLIAIPALYTSVMGPLGHYVLLLPNLAAERLRSWKRARKGRSRADSGFDPSDMHTPLLRQASTERSLSKDRTASE